MNLPPNANQAEAIDFEEWKALKERRQETHPGNHYKTITARGEPRSVLGNAFGGTATASGLEREHVYNAIEISDTSTLIQGDLRDISYLFGRPKTRRKAVQARELQRVQTGIALQQSVLQNQWSILYTEAGVREDEVLGTEKDSNSSRSRALALRKYLGNDYETFADLLDEIQNNLQHIEKLTKSLKLEIAGLDLRARSWRKVLPRLRYRVDGDEQQRNYMEAQPTRANTSKNSRRDENVASILQNLDIVRMTLFDTLKEIQQLYQPGSIRNVAEFDLQESNSIDEADDASSTNPTENDGRTLDFLRVSLLRDKARVVIATNVMALLDSGATVCCMSKELADVLRLPRTREEINITVSPVATADASPQTMRSSAATTIYVQWYYHGPSVAAKRKFHIVEGFTFPMILSNQFTKDHKDVFEAAETRETSESINTTGFGKMKAEDFLREVTISNTQINANRQWDQQREDAKQAELNRILGIPTSGPNINSATSTLSASTTQASTASGISNPTTASATNATSGTGATSQNTKHGHFQ